MTAKAETAAIKVIRNFMVGCWLSFEVTAGAPRISSDAFMAFLFRKYSTFPLLELIALMGKCRSY